MEILSINFAIFVVQFAFCIVPHRFGNPIIYFFYRVKDETRQKISKKLLGDSNLIKSGFFFNFVLYSITVYSLLFE